MARSNLRALILADPRAGRVPQLYLPRLASRLEEVPPLGRARAAGVQRQSLQGVSNFRDGTAEVTPALADRVEQIARAIPHFHFGRIDARYESLSALRRGEGFTIIEINGVGSEATHVWGPDTTLRRAYSHLSFHYRAAFEIGRAMRARGHRPSGLRALFGFSPCQLRPMPPIRSTTEPPSREGGVGAAGHLAGFADELRKLPGVFRLRRSAECNLAWRWPAHTALCASPERICWRAGTNKSYAHLATTRGERAGRCEPGIGLACTYGSGWRVN